VHIEWPVVRRRRLFAQRSVLGVGGDPDDHEFRGGYFAGSALSAGLAQSLTAARDFIRFIAWYVSAEKQRVTT
jgi:hypothetical protein